MANIKFLYWLAILIGGFCAGILQAAPVIRITPQTVLLGSFPANREQSCEFTVFNNGDETLLLDKIKSTCGCAVGEATVSELKAGDSTTVTVKIVPESITGPFSKVLFIHSNDPSTPIASVSVSGVSMPLVTVLPQNYIYAGTLTEGEEWKQDFLLQTSEPVEWEEITFSGTVKDATVKLKSFETKEDGTKREYHLSVAWKPVEAVTMFQLTIQLPIAVPSEWKPVELFIQGKVIARE